ncbi:hypothetical protein EV361DRAFT_951146 [Lentinula raphanica]|nr:hypothetical protein EV361DRAFT_951146 [Lentinula raphanica]
MASYSMDIDVSSDNLKFMRFHPSFLYEPGSVVLRSEDDWCFALDPDNLRTATGHRTLDASCSTIPGVAEVPYPSHVLEALFWCIYPRPFPCLDAMNFDQLMLFGRAANYFCVHSAVALSIAVLKKYVHQHPKDILAFAVQCGYDCLIKEVASTEFLNAPLSEVAGVLPDSLFKAWCLYRDSKANRPVDCLTQ